MAAWWTAEDMRLIIAPSILACDLAHLADSLRAAEEAGADWHHVDVMDGHFVPNLTFGPDIVKAVRSVSALPLDVHLMVEEPAQYAEPFIRAGANVVTYHAEVLPDPIPLARRIRALGARPGLVLKPKSPVSTIVPFLNEMDVVMIMTVEPGFTGQEFMPECVEKVAELRRRAGRDLDIEVDGGINEQTVELTARAGANVAVVGASVYRSGDIRAAVAAIRKGLEHNYRATD